MKNSQVSGNLHGERLTLRQISKPTAKKLYEQGKTVYLQSCKFHPFGDWSAAFPINKEDNQGHMNWAANDALFTNRVNSFEYYNCSSEQGRYAHFYVAV